MSRGVAKKAKSPATRAGKAAPRRRGGAKAQETTADPRLAGDMPVVVIGAGFGGVGAGIFLKRAGIDSFVIVERAGDVGGTWRDNTYPGCACDVASYLYSYSFEPNPDWTRMFSPSAEIHAYIRHCADKYGITPHLKLNTAIAGAHFDEARGRWLLTTDKGERLEARVVISCVGGLVNPALPDIPGLQSFAGPQLHTARWDHGVALDGKRVAVIGTGASAIQVVPAIAPRVGHMDVFQRTAPWIMPKPDYEISALRKRLYHRVPVLHKAHRLALATTYESFAPMVVIDSPLTSLSEMVGRRHLRQSVRDPELRRRLTPNFRIGCKRTLISNDYYPALQRDNVALVTEGIARVDATGIHTRDGQHHPCDVLVLATGFRLDIGRAPFPVIGLGGRSLDDVWSGGATAYKGMTVSGFPNWFSVLGPNTGPGHTSVLIYSEAQFQHATEAIQAIRGGNLRYVNVRQAVQDRYNEGIQRRMRYSTWKSGCTSWYLDEHGVNRTLYPGFAAEYVLRARHFQRSDYELVR